MKTGTLEDILLNISGEWMILVLGMLIVTVIGCAGSIILKKISDKAAGNFMSVPFYITVVPGVFFTLILLYLLFFTAKNLLTVPAFYFFPLLHMAISLFLFSKIIDFKNIPGFEKLSGFILFLSVSFSVILLIFKLRIIAIAWFSPVYVVIVVFILYLLWKSGLKKFLGKK